MLKIYTQNRIRPQNETIEHGLHVIWGPSHPTIIQMIKHGKEISFYADNINTCARFTFTSMIRTMCCKEVKTLVKPNFRIIARNSFAPKNNFQLPLKNRVPQVRYSVIVRAIKMAIKRSSQLSTEPRIWGVKRCEHGIESNLPRNYAIAGAKIET